MKKYDHISRELILHEGISTEAERVFLNVEMIERICALGDKLPLDGHKATYLETSNFFAEAQELSKLAEDLALRYGLPGAAGKCPEFDFEFPSYDEFHADAAKIREEMDEIPLAELPGFIQRDIKTANALRYEDHLVATRQEAPVPLKASMTVSGYLMSKILAGLGLKGLVTGIIEIIGSSGPWGVMISAWRAGDMKTFKNALKLLMKFIFKGKFLNLLIKKVGESAAKKILATMTGRFVPFLGWALIIGGILYAIYEEA